jgi:hypothetical protein
MGIISSHIEGKFFCGADFDVRKNAKHALRKIGRRSPLPYKTLRIRDPSSVLCAAAVDNQFPLLLEDHISMVLKSVIDRPDYTYCITDHIHFAATSTFVAFSLEKGRTYFCPDICVPSDISLSEHLTDALFAI